MTAQNSESELINLKVDNLVFTIMEMVQQIKDKNPLLGLYKGKGDQFTYDPNGMIERVSTRLYWSFNQDDSRIGRIIHEESSDGLFYEVYGMFDHNLLLSILEESLINLKENKNWSLEYLQAFYEGLQGRLKTMKDESNRK